MNINHIENHGETRAPIPDGMRCAAEGCTKPAQGTAKGSDGKRYCCLGCMPADVGRELTDGLLCAAEGCTKRAQSWACARDGTPYCSLGCNPQTAIDEAVSAAAVLGVALPVGGSATREGIAADIVTSDVVRGLPSGAAAYLGAVSAPLAEVATWSYQETVRFACSQESESFFEGGRSGTNPRLRKLDGEFLTPKDFRGLGGKTLIV